MNIYIVKRIFKIQSKHLNTIILCIIMVNTIKYKWGQGVYTLYTPQVNRKRQGLLIVAFIPFLLTIGTNWLYFVGLRILLKLNPLFLYK